MPLPELERATGWPEDVFTNRDVNHIAISNDDGKTWYGFREFILDARRNETNWAETGGSDRGTHQPQFVELGDNKILVSFGQHELHRRMAIIDLKWVAGYSRSGDFRDDEGRWSLADWSTQQYVAGVRGHCSYNRRPGAQLEPHPNDPKQPMLRVARPDDAELLCENQGAVWNFPAGRIGEFSTRIMLPESSQGGQINLMNRWFNPTDLTAEQFAMFTLDIAGDGTIADARNIQQFGGRTNWVTLEGPLRLVPGVWYDVSLSWEQLEDTCFDICIVNLSNDQDEFIFNLPLKNPSRIGISNVQFLSTAQTTDTHGLLIGGASGRGGGRFILH